MSTPTSILSRGVSVYSIPTELLANLSVRSIQAQPPAEAEEIKPKSTAAKTAQANLPGAAGLSCQTCPNANFDTVEEQRAHFKSDWHRYNAKAKLAGRTVSAEQWEGMVEGISSISGSDSGSSSSSGSSSQSKVARLLKRQTIDNNQNLSDDEEALELADRQRRAHLRTAVIWFSPTTSIPSLGVPKDTQFGVHRALFPPFDTAADYLTELKRMQLSGNNEEDGERRLTLLMVAGGHFAGMIVSIKPRGKSEKQEVKGAGEVRVLKHKTFHRYTTRKKQGGSQALNDNAKSKAVSAGAMLRRYGEQALQEEIRALMIEWEDDLAASERIFIRASTHGKKSFYGYEGAVLSKNDERFRTFPFPTRRPTLQELLRCWHELTRMKVSHLSEDALRAFDEEYIASLQPKNKPIKPTPAPTPAPTAPAIPKLSPEEEAKLDRRKRLEEMIRKGRLDALKPFWTKYQTDFEPSEILGLVASSVQEEMLKYLLEEERLDPTQPILTSNNRKPYELSANKNIRNVFRRVAHNHPEWYDWVVDARVPSGLSDELEQEQNTKKNERRKGLKEKLKEREKQRAAEAEVEEAREKEAEEQKQKEEAMRTTAMNLNGNTGANKGPQKLGGRVGGEGLGGMSQEMRMQIERERRARAAEARFGRG
ncbi:cytoplasmic protein [Kwoniella mangroviensis CBS 10435]|uniref:Cytoplasmic protein n=1 Tax=Kwoniella mangroviensis CBS 10435 TaxID=1331196 RepID=A0A1B9IQX6_9TREE|nr:cytoplasmic protein [Kwoniella mangroviensis CBS 10435]